MTVRRYLVFALLAPLIIACTRRDKETAAAQDVADTVGTARHLVVVPPVTTPYHAIDVTNGGTVSGTVTYLGKPTADTVILIPADQNGCSKPLTIMRLARKNGALAGAVVWLTDIRAGRALPLDRRYTLTNSDCAWDPVVQTVATGGAINVVNEDPLVERAYITDVAKGDTVAKAPFTDDGQVIPYDRLIQNPGVYEFSVESRPNSRAWVVALDHPYVAITKEDGRFTLDGVPPGTYKIRAWHPMLGVVDGTATVTAGQTATVNLQFP